AEHRAQANGACRFGEAHDAVHAVVVGDGQRGEPEAGGLLGQLLGTRRAVEEAEVRVAVEFGIRRGRAPRLSGNWRWLIRRAMAPPCGGVAVRPAAICNWPVRENPLELGPRQLWVVEAHAATSVVGG